MNLFFAFCVAVSLVLVSGYGAGFERFHSESAVRWDGRLIDPRPLFIGDECKEKPLTLVHFPRYLFSALSDRKRSHAKAQSREGKKAYERRYFSRETFFAPWRLCVKLLTERNELHAAGSPCMQAKQVLSSGKRGPEVRSA